jgi:hypothetical protein
MLKNDVQCVHPHWLLQVIPCRVFHPRESSIVVIVRDLQVHFVLQPIVEYYSSTIGQKTLFAR